MRIQVFLNGLDSPAICFHLQVANLETFRIKYSFPDRYLFCLAFFYFLRTIHGLSRYSPILGLQDKPNES